MRCHPLVRKDAMGSDYYKILSVGRNATAKEIHSAYLRLALEHHPDLNHRDPSSAGRFKQIHTAYEVLSDSQKRAQYDRDPKAWGTSPVVHATGRRSPPVEPVTVRPAHPRKPTRVRYDALHQSRENRLYKYGILAAVVVVACTAFVGTTGVPPWCWQRLAKASPDKGRPADRFDDPVDDQELGLEARDQITRPESALQVADQDHQASGWPTNVRQNSLSPQDRSKDTPDAAVSDDWRTPSRMPDLRLEPPDPLTRFMTFGADRRAWADPSANPQPTDFETWVSSEISVDAMDLELAEFTESVDMGAAVSLSVMDDDSRPWRPSLSNWPPSPVESFLFPVDTSVLFPVDTSVPSLDLPELATDSFGTLEAAPLPNSVGPAVPWNPRGQDDPFSNSTGTAYQRFSPANPALVKSGIAGWEFPDSTHNPRHARSESIWTALVRKPAGTPVDMGPSMAMEYGAPWRPGATTAPWWARSRLGSLAPPYPPASHATSGATLPTRGP